MSTSSCLLYAPKTKTKESPFKVSIYLMHNIKNCKPKRTHSSRAAN